MTTIRSTSTPEISYVGYAQAAFDSVGILSSNASEEQKYQAIKERIGLTVADYYTAGFASVAVGFLDRTFPGFMSGVRKFAAALDPLGNAIAGLFDTNRWKTEGNRLKKLIEQGIHIPEALQGAMNLTRGRSKEELVDPSVSADFVGFRSDGAWVNNRFALSRNEADLRAEDIWGNAAFFEKFGNAWLGKFSEDQRRIIAEQALASGAVREHTGTITITWTPELEQNISTITARP